jgi:hypothetical protein
VVTEVAARRVPSPTPLLLLLLLLLLAVVSICWLRITSKEDIE